MPGVRIRFCPLARASLIASASSLGSATKKWSIGIDEPAAGPAPHAVPAESWRSAGTKTRYRPDESRYRKGLSRVTGLAGSVVQGGGPNRAAENDCAGAPTAAEKTW